MSLSLLTLLSVVALPVAGASPGDSGSVASVDVDPGGEGPLANAGQAGGAGGNSSSGNSDGSGGGQANGNGGGDGGSQASGNGGGGGGSQANGNGGGDGGSQAGGNGSGDGGSQASGNDGGGKTNGNDGGSQAGGNGGGQANGNDGGNGGGQANGNDGGDGGSQANGNDGGDGGSQAGGNGGGRDSNLPGPAKVDIGSIDVDVDLPDDVGPPDDSNAGGNGPPDDAGPPDDSNAGGNGPPDDTGPPENSNAGGQGPSVSVTAGAPGEQGLDRANAVSGGNGPSSVVSVSVENARAGSPLDLDVSPTEAEDDAVAFEGISVTVKRGGDFTMRVSNSRERLPGSPAFEPEQAADSLGRIRLDHSITNEEVEEVSYTFRVSKGHLRGTDTDPEDVSLFRYADGEWSELPTDVVGETETHYLLESDSPGMSEFAVGAKRPDFDTFWANVEAGSVDAGESVTVRGRVTNDGGADGVYDARLVVDGQIVAQRSITIAAGGTRQINFRTELYRPGSKRISINEVAAGEVSVEEQPVEPEADPDDPALTLFIDRLLDVSRALGITAPT